MTTYPGFAAPVPEGLARRLLAEDVPAGDLTTEALGIGAIPARMIFRARAPMTVAGIGTAAALIAAAGGTPRVEAVSGHQADANEILLTASGTAGALHAAWKSAQTLVEILSGIATAARAIVMAAAAENKDVRVACTRKAVPGARGLSLEAIRAGGAIPHRIGLSETVLVFAEHRAFLRGWPLAQIAERLRREAPEKKLAIEVHSAAEAREAIAGGFDVVQLEKFTLEDVAAVAAYAVETRSPALLAAAGGITPENAPAYVRAGARLLVTSWPYTARPADVAVELGPAG